MTPLRSAALAAILLALSTSFAFAHHGVVHTGCPTGQVFTQGDITVTGAFLRATPKGAQSAGGYLTISNAGSAPDTMTGATTEAATDALLHTMNMNGSVMEMAPMAGGLALPPGSTVALSPMGDHLMLTGMEQPFVTGQCVQMVLHFAKAGDLPIELTIGGPGQMTPPTGDTPPASMPPMDMSGMSSMEGM